MTGAAKAVASRGRPASARALILFALCAWAGVAASQACAAAAGLDLTSLLPRSGAVQGGAPPAGWRMQGKPAAYTRATLFDYIDGGADFYLAYGFKRAVVAGYTGANDAKVTVELYDMGSSADAFGVFSHEQAEESPPVGQESSYAGGLLTFWKDSLFARLFADRETPQTREAILKLGKAVSASVRARGGAPPAGQKPALLRLLPTSGLARRSVRYLHTETSLNSVLYLPGNPLGLNSKTEVAYGEYPRAGGAPAKVAVVQYPTIERARAAFLALDKQLGGQGVMPVTHVAFYKTDRYRRVGAVVLEPYVGLAANAPDSATARRLVDAVIVGIKKRWAERTADGGGI